jgi:presenilin-like A22 family membrane protease
MNMRLIVSLLLFFLLAQVLGLFTGMIILEDFDKNPYVSSMLVTSNSQDPLNALFLIGYILVSAVLIVFVIRKFKLNLMLFRVVEFFLISTSSSIVFYSVIRLILGYDLSTLAGIIMGLSFAGAKVFLPQLKNPAAILATAGVGVIFGISLGIVPILIFLTLLSVYDFLSVFVTRHMVEIADFVISKDLAFTVTARTEVPGEPVKRIDLGTGDLIAPVMLEVSLLSYSSAASLFVMLGSIVSMTLFLFLVWKKKLVLPALPPIVLGMVAGLILGFLIGAY